VGDLIGITKRKWEMWFVERIIRRYMKNFGGSLDRVQAANLLKKQIDNTSI
jgi:hypothetical protein